ncbi:sigma-70 family RNA polymerase sigma factor [Streptomyces sp. NPDC059819]|uniref:sigma-70 family RNA polymerase sigma factor n=1 Tax=Streptomyces sp. NPDC059819 TaxID=3346963 RepID=UPI00364E0ED4
MFNISTDLIAAAKRNEISAVTEVISTTEPLIAARAREYATVEGKLCSDLLDDLMQAGRIAVWGCLTSFKGAEGGQFLAFIERELRSTMRDTQREVVAPGMTAQTAKDFELALSIAHGDPYDAVRVACTSALGDRKMSPERANAALLAWLGTDSLDRPLNEGAHGEGITLGDVIASQVGVSADLLDQADYEQARRKTIRDQVHRTLGALGERQRHVLKADHGITPVRDYGKHGSDAELAEDMGATAKQIQEARSKGKNRFRELYQAGARAW